MQNLGWGAGPILGAAFAAVAGIPALYVAAGAPTLVTSFGVRGSRAWFPARATVPLAPPSALIEADAAD